MFNELELSKTGKVRRERRERESEGERENWENKVRMKDEFSGDETKRSEKRSERQQQE